jgi:hypothetical protein
MRWVDQITEALGVEKVDEHQMLFLRHCTSGDKRYVGWFCHRGCGKTTACVILIIKMLMDGYSVVVHVAPDQDERVQGLVVNPVNFCLDRFNMSHKKGHLIISSSNTIFRTGTDSVVHVINEIDRVHPVLQDGEPGLPWEYNPTYFTSASQAMRRSADPGGDRTYLFDAEALNFIRTLHQADQ